LTRKRWEDKRASEPGIVEAMRNPITGKDGKKSLDRKGDGGLKRSSVQAIGTH